MSREHALAFLALAERDAALREEILLLKGPGAIEGLAKIGAARGLVFSAEEYRQAVVAMANGELDDAALMTVLEEVGLAKGNPYAPKIP